MIYSTLVFNHIHLIHQQLITKTDIRIQIQRLHELTDRKHALKSASSCFHR